MCFVNSDRPLAWCFVCKLQCVVLSPESGTSLYTWKHHQPHPLFCATQQRSLPPWAAAGGVSQKTQQTDGGGLLHCPRKSFSIFRLRKWQVFNVAVLNAAHFTFMFILRAELLMDLKPAFLLLTWASRQCLLRGPLKVECPSSLPGSPPVLPFLFAAGVCIIKVPVG